MTIRFVIFDMDNVLYDYDHPRRLKALAELSGNTPEDIDRIVFQGPEEQAAEARTPDNAADYLAQYQRLLGYDISWDRWIEIRRDMMEEWPVMLDYVRTIKTKYDIALLTNNGMMLGENLYEIAPALKPLFEDKGHASAEFGTRKPDPEIYRIICAKYGYEPHEALFIDDRIENVEGALEAGLNGCHFTSEEAFAGHMRGLGLL